MIHWFMLGYPISIYRPLSKFLQLAHILDYLHAYGEYKHMLPLEMLSVGYQSINEIQFLLLVLFLNVYSDRIIPADAITPSEKRQTLLRLNQVIQHRLVTGNLPAQMRKFKIENGRVKFHVEHEFEVTLTVMGDGPQVPWRLLNIVILVEDKETGEGKELVHTLQVNYIQQLIQARLVESPRALTEVFNILHSFCQMLQLEVLYTQTLRLMIDRLEDHICVDEYMPGVRLTVSYWRELTKVDPKSELGYKFTVQTDPSDEARPLAVIHSPSIGAKETAEVADRSVRSDLLSMERLLVHTVYIRTLVRLNDLKVEFQTFLKDVDCKWPRFDHKFLANIAKLALQLIFFILCLFGT